ncbi:hypothetical protein BDZ97DRAFT_1755150 [Flammula alnicola]|nr:hypothetical protein BDZ97DRAFT_1080548 [Flammula alnicola]KAF8968458.1 hypothetical protein BDZ97DRAFT_1755150 [Flammula alnicola]
MNTQIVPSCRFSKTRNKQRYKVIDFPLEPEHLCRLATRICGEDVIDEMLAYEVVIGEALQLGFDVPPAKRVCANCRDENITIIFAVFDDLHPARSGTENPQNPERLLRAIDWLEENGLPEIGQIAMVPAIVEL